MARRSLGRRDALHWKSSDNVGADLRHSLLLVWQLIAPGILWKHWDLSWATRPLMTVIEPLRSRSYTQQWPHLIFFCIALLLIHPTCDSAGMFYHNVVQEVSFLSWCCLRKNGVSPVIFLRSLWLFGQFQVLCPLTHRQQETEMWQKNSCTKARVQFAAKLLWPEAVDEWEKKYQWHPVRKLGKSEDWNSKFVDSYGKSIGQSVVRF